MEENWDDADCAPYVPQWQNKKITREVPPNLTKSQKKKFRQKEQKHWKQIREAEKSATSSSNEHKKNQSK